MKLISFLLAVLSLLLLWLLALPLYIIGLFMVRIHHVYHMNIAISFDQLGGVLGAPLFNVILRKKGGATFGNPDETISSVLGKLKKSGHLTGMGKFFATLLNKIEKQHVEKAIEEDENIK
jgi:hypothetical protein